MRIAVIAPPWLPVPPDGYGGTELVLDTLCRGLAAAGHDVLLSATGDSTCPVERAWTYPEHLGTVAISPAGELCHVMDAYDAALAWGAEVIHDHTITGPVWAGLHGRCPVVTTNHGPFSADLALPPRTPEGSGWCGAAGWCGRWFSRGGTSRASRCGRPGPGSRRGPARGCARRGGPGGCGPRPAGGWRCSP